MINLEYVVKEFKKQGKNVEYTAKAIGCTGKVVRDYLKKAKVRFGEHVSEKELMEQRKKEILQVYEECGDAVDALVKKSGYSEPTIVRYLKEMGLPVRQRAQRSLELEEKACAVYEIAKGNSAEAERILNSEGTYISVTKIRTSWRKNGLEISSHGGGREKREKIPYSFSSDF